MFTASQEIRLNTGGSGSLIRSNCSNNNSTLYSDSNKIFERYQKAPDAGDLNPVSEYRVKVATEDIKKVQLLQFPNDAVQTHSDVHFALIRNGLQGNFEVKLEKPSGEHFIVPGHNFNLERFDVSFNLNQVGLYKVHITCNSVTLPKSPFIIVSVCDDMEKVTKKIELPAFSSDATQVTHRGLALSDTYLNEKNEFIVDASKAGRNIFFCGIIGPKGQCEETIVKHLGRNIYKVVYEIQYPGEYVIIAKWGDDHIPGSPFILKPLKRM